MREYIGTYGKQEGYIGTFRKTGGILVHFAKQEGYIGTFRRNHSNKSPVTVGLPDEGGGYIGTYPNTRYIGTLPP